MGKDDILKTIFWFVALNLDSLEINYIQVANINKHGFTATYLEGGTAQVKRN